MHMADSLCLCTYVFPLFPGCWQHLVCVIGYIWLLIKPVKRFPYVGPGCHASAILIMDRPCTESPPH